MRKLLILLLLGLLLHTSCLNSSDKINNSFTRTDAIPCDSLLYLLLQSADIDTFLKQQLFITDGFDNGRLLIKIYHENEVEKDAIFDAADGFLLIDTLTRKLFKALIAEETSIEIRCDKNVLNAFINRCVRHFVKAGQTEKLPFIGKRYYETRPGVSGKATPHKRVEIKENGFVEFAFIQESMADKTITRGVYNAGPFKKNMKCVFKEWDKEKTFYEITRDRIYETDSNGVRLKSNECCSSYSDTLCSCESEYFDLDW